MLYCTDYRIYQKIMENSKIFIKKNRDTLNQNIFRIPSFTICFFNYLVFFTSSFSILHVYGFQKIVKFLCCFIVWIWDVIKKFCKSMVLSSKKSRYLKSNISTNFHRLIFRFSFFLHFWHFVSYFTYPNLSKNYWIFCSVLLEGLEILPTISGKF